MKTHRNPLIMILPVSNALLLLLLLFHFHLFDANAINEKGIETATEEKEGANQMARHPIHFTGYNNGEPTKSLVKLSHEPMATNETSSNGTEDAARIRQRPGGRRTWKYNSTGSEALMKARAPAKGDNNGDGDEPVMDLKALTEEEQRRCAHQKGHGGHGCGGKGRKRRRRHRRHRCGHGKKCRRRHHKRHGHGKEHH